MLLYIVFSKRIISPMAIMLPSECFTQTYFSKWRVKKLSFLYFFLWKDIICLLRTNKEDNINNLDRSLIVNEVVSSVVLEMNEVLSFIDLVYNSVIICYLSLQELPDVVLWELITDIICKVYRTFYFF